ncbi:Pentatricopeptide repeat-containing protein At5g59600 [Linum grandiflorum]
MLTNGFCPSHATISGLLPACASSANVRRGKELHCYAAVIGVEDDIYVRSALVDMYAKSGFIHEAKLMFHRTPKKNTATWNSMIFGNANNGCSDEAIRLFTQMEKMEGDKVDHLTFTAVFTACSHAGMVELGQSLFVLMQRKYNIAPRMEHYACMVDLLGNAGRVKEAYEVIKSIPMEPDLFVWGALLGACRKHGDIELGDIAAQKLAKLEPRNTGNNVLMSSLHAEAGSWSTVARFKKMLNSKKMRFSGCSWIESG